MPVYLDYNATTPVDQSVSSIIHSTLSEAWGNPSSSYSLGENARNIIERARQQVSNMIKCDSNEIVFTSGGTESNHMVIHSAVEYFIENHKVLHPVDLFPKPHVITTNIEHDSITLPLKHLYESGKIEVSFVPVSKKSGSVSVADILKAVQSNTCLITVMMANNETGVIQPVKLISSAVQAKYNDHFPKILIHTDAAQAIGKICVDAEDLGVDYLTIVGHKFYGPRIGALYFKQGVALHPVFRGGGQERRYRPGTENTCMISGLGRAAELVAMNLAIYEAKMLKICNYLENALQKEFPDKVIFNVRSNVDRLPNTVSVAFNYDNITGRALLTEAKDICASTGAACHSGGKLSSILLASGVSEELASKTLRLSIGRETTEADIDKAVLSLKIAIANLC